MLRHRPIYVCEGSAPGQVVADPLYAFCHLILVTTLVSDGKPKLGETQSLAKSEPMRGGTAQGSALYSVASGKDDKEERDISQDRPAGFTS